MLGKIIFITSVIAAILVVILLANLKLSLHHRKYRPISISLYIQPPYPQSSIQALIFHNNLTITGKNTCQVVGKVEGFLLLPDKQIKNNVMYLTFDTVRYEGSIAIEPWGKGKRSKFVVVGGTGYFAFVQGFAAILHLNRHLLHTHANYFIILKLRVPAAH